MNDEHIGKRLSRKDIFNMFPDMGIVGVPDSSEYPIIYITIKYIGTPEEAEVEVRKNRGTTIVYGRTPRASKEVIYNSKITLIDMVGLWFSSVPGDGSMQSEGVVLKCDGSGGFAENHPAWSVPIEWYVENDMFFIVTDDYICKRVLEYEPHVIVTGMGADEYHYTRIKHGAYGITFYREIKLGNTLDDWENEAEEEYQMMVKYNPHFIIM